jgi:hypothetical protein
METDLDNMINESPIGAVAIIDTMDSNCVKVTHEGGGDWYDENGILYNSDNIIAFNSIN